MKKRKYIYMHLFVKNYSEKLQMELEKKIKKFFKDEFLQEVFLKITSVEKYWKIPELTSIELKILNVPDDDILKKIVDSLNLRCTMMPDSLIWSKDPDGGCFIDEDIDWVEVAL